MSTERTVHSYSSWLRDEIVNNAVATVKKHGLKINGEPVRTRAVSLAVRSLLKRYTTTSRLLKAWPGLEERGMAYEFPIEDIEKIIKDWRESECRQMKIKALHEASPELLEALQETIHEIGHWLSIQKPELKEKIESAINKALGEKQ